MTVLFVYHRQILKIIRLAALTKPFYELLADVPDVVDLYVGFKLLEFIICVLIVICLR